MKNKILRRTLLALAVLVLLAALAVALGHLLGARKAERRIDVKVAPLAVPEGADAIERGRYLYASRGCADCHGADGGGRKFIDGDGLRVIGAHIAAGPGSVTAAYRVEDRVRAVRHGVKPDGRPVRVMPSEDYNRMTDADLGALVAYVRRLPPVKGLVAEVTLPLPVRVLYGYGQVQDAAEKIDHALPPANPVPEGATVEHGRYVAEMCKGCHGVRLSGGKVPGGPPAWPAAANLTPGSASGMAAYGDLAAFAKMMKTGKRADGSPVAVMPFEALAQLNDVDMAGLHAYLKSLPPLPAGGR